MASPTVFLVDDAPAIRESFSFLLEANNLPVETFASAAEFFEKYERDRPGCLVLDVRMPDMSGLEMQEVLNRTGITLPVIILSGHADVQIASTAFRAGAIDVFEKPVPHKVLLKRIHEGIELDARQRSGTRLDPAIERRMELLTPKERTTLDQMLTGASIKQMASHSDVSIQTIAKHRARVLEKMEVENEVKLIHLLGGIAPPTQE